MESWIARFVPVLLVWGLSAAAPCRAEEAPDEERKFNVASAISPNGKWLVLFITEMEADTSEIVPDVTFMREAGRKLFRVALSAKKPKVALLHESKEPDVRAYVYNNTRYFANALVLDDGTAIAMTAGTNLARWNSAGKFSEHKVFKESSFRQLSLITGGRKLIANRRTFGAKRTITNEIVDLKTHQIAAAPFLNGLLGEPMQWTPDMKHVYGIEMMMTAVPLTTSEGTVISSTRESRRLVRASTQGQEKTVIASDLPYTPVCFGKNVIVYSARGKDGAETFWRVKKADPPVVEAIPGLKSWTPVLALEEDRFLLRSGTERHAIVTFSAAGDEAARTPPIELLALPQHKDILYSATLKAFLLSKDGVTYKLVDVKGAELWQIQLAQTGGKGK
jgi:hypothetical protein